MKSQSPWLKVSLIGLSAIAAAAAAAACSTSDAGDDSAAAGSATGGTANSSAGTGTGTGGSTPIAGSTSTGGSTVGTAGNGGGGGVEPMGVACPKATIALLTDFTPVDGGGMGMFGVVGTTFAGGTFQFTDTITADFSAGDWHVSGMVTDFSALALFFQDCNEVDASMFKGISFTVKGSIPSPLTPNTLNFQVGTAADDISTAWFNSHNADAGAPVKATFGRCAPPGSNQYDGSCASPSFTVPVTATATTVSVLWSDLKGGKPAATVDPKEITSIIWGLPAPAGAGGAMVTPYALDVTIDDLSFIE